jgi:hypothetical protein
VNGDGTKTRTASDPKVRASLPNLNATEVAQNAAELRTGHFVSVRRSRHLSSLFDTLTVGRAIIVLAINLYLCDCAALKKKLRLHMEVAARGREAA